MLRFVLKRVGISIPLLVFISVLSYLIVHLSPSNPAEVILQARGVPLITDDLIQQTERQLGLHLPLWEQYGRWLKHVLQFDFGYSYLTGESVVSMIYPAFLNTMKLTLIASVGIFICSIAVGLSCALSEGKVFDKTVRGTFFILLGIPSYLLATILIWFFSIYLDWLPTNGMGDVKSYILPVAIIMMTYVGVYFRTIRSSVITNLNENYVLYARANGWKRQKIIKQVLMNSLQVTVSIFFMGIPTIVGGTVIVENVFAWPGLGMLSVDAALRKDLPVLQAYMLILATSFVFFSIVSDCINQLLNPKLRRMN